MNKNDVLDYLIQHNIDLNVNKIFLNKKTNIPYAIGCYFENELWYLYEVGERQDFYIIQSGSEKEVFQHFFLKIIDRVENQREVFPL